MSNADNIPQTQPPTTKRALVTGGGGFVGFALVKELLKQGFTVKTFSRKEYLKLHQLGVTQISGDLHNLNMCIQAAADVDVVFHTAANPAPWGQYEDFYNTNTLGTQNIIEACRAEKVGYLVYTSSPSVVFAGESIEDGNEFLPYPEKFESFYSQTKALAEQSVKSVTDPGLKTIILRPHDIWGPEDPNFTPRILGRAGKLKQIGDGSNLIDATYIDNVIQAHLLAYQALLEKPQLAGKVYFITNDEPMPAWNIINKILELGGKPPVTKTFSFTLAYGLGTIFEKIWHVFNLSGEPPIMRFTATALSQSHWFDISAAKRDLNYYPKVSMAEGFERLGAWLKENQDDIIAK